MRSVRQGSFASLGFAAARARAEAPVELETALQLDPTSLRA
jgi:hypothetical protein